MAVIEINVSDDLLQQIGSDGLKLKMERYLEDIKVQKIVVGIQAAVHEHGLDWETELMQARQQAWQEYKQRYLRGLV